jgi:hypothetical protein
LKNRRPGGVATALPEPIKAGIVAMIRAAQR